MLEITLRIEGTEKKFTQPKQTLGAMRRMAEMDKNIRAMQADGNEEDHGLEMIDEMAFTIVALFSNQFSFDELVYGLEFETMEEFHGIVEDLFAQVGGEGKKPTAKKTPVKKAPTK